MSFVVEILVVQMSFACLWGAIIGASKCIDVPYHVNECFELFLFFERG